MRKSAEKMHKPTLVEYVACVLKLDKRKFVCYVEEYIDHVPPLGPTANAVKIVSKRRKAWRAAIAMALACSGRARIAKDIGTGSGKGSGKYGGKDRSKDGGKTSGNIPA